jgi:hypothetical protein
MKTFIKTAAICFTALFIFSQCENNSGNSSRNVNNEFLNKIPSTAKNYAEKLEAKEKAIHECTDFNETFKLNKELDLLKEEWTAKIKEIKNTSPIIKPLLFDELTDAPFQIIKITVDNENINRNNLKMIFDIEIKNDIKNEFGGFEKSLFVYYVAINSQGNPISESCSVATQFKREELKAGLKLQVYGQLSPLENMEDFARLKIITRSEYEEFQKK